MGLKNKTLQELRNVGLKCGTSSTNTMLLHTDIQLFTINNSALGY